jgi:protein disulfide-isomerase
MKNWGLLALLALPTIVSSVPAAPAKKKAGATVKWHPNYTTALAEAKRTGKPVFIDFYTTWCGPCKFLDEVTYKDAKFVAESKNWIMVKIDAEKNKTNVQLAQKFKVEGYPTMVFLKPNGKEADRAVGGYPASMLVPKMEKAAEKALGGKSI